MESDVSKERWQFDQIRVLRKIALLTPAERESATWEHVASSWLQLSTNDESCRRAVSAVTALVERRLVSGDMTWLGLRRFSLEVTPEEVRAMSRVFVVHGHDDLKHVVARFIEKLGLEAVILAERASGGAGILEKIERYGDVAFAVVLLTPDDVGGPAEGAQHLRPRARQNVILELGYFIGRLGRARVHCLYKGDIELPSDYHGIVYSRTDAAGVDWRVELARELEHAGVVIDRRSI